MKKLRDICFGTIDDGRWFADLEATHWLRHVKVGGVLCAFECQTLNDAFDAIIAQHSFTHCFQLVLAGAAQVVESISKGTSVLVHCSDGWDRTGQLCGLSMLCLDPYYRTIRGFAV